jgi:pSer/pThr/pTyr-binding forkhead associated (FHA) protein
MVWLFVLFCKKGASGENEYGPDPTDADHNDFNSNAMNPTKPDYQNSNQNDGTIPNGGGFENYALSKKKTLIGEQEETISVENPKSKYALAGFLVSFSKTETGEFWDLREGNNAIGSTPDNDIQLQEEHVSGKHANINVSKDAPNNKWKFQMVDLSAANGTDLNGTKLPIYTGVDLNSFDKIKIGEYEAVLFATDKFIHGLQKSEKFISAQQSLDYDSMSYNSKNE